MIDVRDHMASSTLVRRIIDDNIAAAPGPSLVVIGGLHANEPAGIEAAERVHAAIAHMRVSLRSGRLVSLRGNLAALAEPADSPFHRRRYIDEDLNRAFVDPPDADEGRSAEQHERVELSRAIGRIVDESDGPIYLLDLHTVSSDSPAFVALEDSLLARRFAMCFPLPKVLGMEEVLDGLLADHATTEHGCVSCIAEAGRHDDPRATDVHEALVLLALESLGIIAAGSTTATGERPFDVALTASGGRSRHFYDLRQRVPIRDRSFRMNPGSTAFMPVVAGVTEVAVELAQPLRVGQSGYLFLPNRQAAPAIGDDAFFVVARIGRVWLALSAWLRQRRAVHRWMPRVLPGVRPRPGDRGALLIAPEYAAVLRREILHLLGYRLIRWRPTPHLSPLRRACRAARGCVTSAFGIIAGAFRGGERRALPGERSADWVARRRRLDVDPPRRPARLFRGQDG